MTMLIRKTRLEDTPLRTYLYIFVCTYSFESMDLGTGVPLPTYTGIQ